MSMKIFYLLILCLALVSAQTIVAQEKRPPRKSVVQSKNAQNESNAHNPVVAAKQEETLTNDSITALVAAGIDEEVIVAKIRSSKTSFDLSTQAIITLNKSGVNKRIIRVMMDPAAADAQLQPTPSAQTTPVIGAQPAGPVPKIDPNDPLSPHEAGIYLLTEKDGERQMIQIDPSIYTQAKSGGLFKSAMTYGIAKVKSKAVLAGKSARLKTDDRKPVFYFYFEVTNTGLSNSGNIIQPSSTTPNEFVLVKMDVKGNKRELVVGQFNVFGAESGALDKYVQAFDYEKIAPGIFKVTPKSSLADGEFGFFYGGSTPIAGYGYFGPGAASKIFDFRVERLP